MSRLRVEAPPAGPLALVTRSLRKRYGPKEALRGVDLAVPRGSVYVLVGPNGAGKTTTLRIVVDLVLADGGRAEVYGLDSHRDAARVRAQIGYLPERRTVPYGWLRVGELLRHHSAYFPAWDEQYAGELSHLLSVDASSRFGQLSKGEQRCVQLVMTLAHRPPLLLLDEPTDGLDPVARERALSALAAHLARFPTTALLSTHHVHEVERLGDHLGVMTGGRLDAQIDRETLRRRLLRYRVRLPERQDLAPPVGSSLLRREGSGREQAWIAWGEEESVRSALRAAGIDVRSVEPLTLAQGALVLLDAPEPAPPRGAGAEPPSPRVTAV